MPGMLAGGDDISISIIGGHEAERCSTETSAGEEREGEAPGWTITGVRETTMGGSRRVHDFMMKLCHI